MSVNTRPLVTFSTGSGQLNKEHGLGLKQVNGWAGEE
jgi:hypothetical protein